MIPAIFYEEDINDACSRAFRTQLIANAQYVFVFVKNRNAFGLFHILKTVDGYANEVWKNDRQIVLEIPEKTDDEGFFPNRIHKLRINRRSWGFFKDML